MACPNNQRKRSVTIAFRVTPEEALKIEAYTAASGLKRQEYICSCLLNNLPEIKPNPRTYALLRPLLENIYGELRRIRSGSLVDDELAKAISILAGVVLDISGRTVQMGVSGIDEADNMVFEIKRY